MDGKNIMFGETSMDQLLQELRASGQPQDLAWLLDRYLHLLRSLVLVEEHEA